MRGGAGVRDDRNRRHLAHDLGRESIVFRERSRRELPSDHCLIAVDLFFAVRRRDGTIAWASR